MSVVLGLLLCAQLNSFEFAEIVGPKTVGDSFNITIVAKDSSGGVYPFNGSALLSTSEDSYWDYVRPNLISFTNGVWQNKVIVTLAESLSLRCLEPQNLVQGESNVFDVLTGPPTRFITILPGEVLAPGSPDGRMPDPPDPRVAGDTFEFDVHLTDAWHNVVPGRTDSVSFGATDRFARLPAPAALEDGSGRFSASLRAAGTQRLVVRPGTGSAFAPDTSTACAVVAGPFDRLLVLLPGEARSPGDTATATWRAPGKDGEPTDQYVGIPFPVFVYGCDPCWNPVGAPGVTVLLQSDFSFSALPDTVTLTDSVQFDVTFGSAGPNQNIWARSLDGQHVSYRTSVDIRPRGTILVVSAPDTVRAGETAYVHVTLSDINHEPVVAAPVRFAVVAGSGAMLDTALLTDTLGRTDARFLCSGAHGEEWDTIRVTADTFVDAGIYVQMPDSILLEGQIIAFPNPFGFTRDRVEIDYYLPHTCETNVAVYDPFGNVVIEWKFAAGLEGGLSGLNRVFWDGHNSRRRRVANGIYVVQVLAQLHTGTIFRDTHRIGVVW